MDALNITVENFKELINKVDLLMKQVENLSSTYPLSERWLDIQETCILLKVSKRTLQSYRDNGVLSFSQIGSKIYYRAADIQSHLEKHYKPAFRN
jgi:hypothetical protein